MEKKPYRRPMLKSLGAVTALTLGMMGSFNDSMTTNNQMMPDPG